MPYFIAPIISKNLPGLWGEGSPYSTETLYDICSGDHSKPPVHYESHLIKPHSICHFDAPGHILKDGITIDRLYRTQAGIFFGPVALLVLETPEFKTHPRSDVLHWEVSLDVLKLELAKLPTQNPITKLILSFKGIKSDFYRSSSHAMTVSKECAEYLTKLPGFNLFGTPWKSADFQPGSRERPVHKELLPSVGILECLNLEGITSGEYFLSAPPLPLEGATESPVAPVLYTREEIQF